EDPARQARVPETDGRKGSSRSHTMDGDIMWFCWATHLECTALVLGREDPRRAQRAILAAGGALGISMDYAFRGRRRTRKEYSAGEATAELIRARALDWSRDFDMAMAEVRDLFRIREWGDS